MASGTGLLDWRRCCWDDEALDLAAVATRRLPTLQEHGWEGRLLPQWRHRWAALAGARWHPAVGDGAAASVGSGCGGPSAINVTIGTSAAVRVVEADDSAAQLSAGLWRYRVDERRVVSGVALAAGGGSYAWACRLAGLQPGAPALAALAEVPIGSNGVTVLPFAGGARAPRHVPSGSAVIAGLGPATTGLDVISATMEAVCFEIAEAVQAVERSRGEHLAVIGCGGALEASPAWQARLVGALNRPIGIVAVPEASARGAALIASGNTSAGVGATTKLQPAERDVNRAATARTAYETLRAAHGIAPPG